MQIPPKKTVPVVASRSTGVIAFSKSAAANERLESTSPELSWNVESMTVERNLCTGINTRNISGSTRSKKRF